MQKITFTVERLAVVCAKFAVMRGACGNPNCKCVCDGIEKSWEYFDKYIQNDDLRGAFDRRFDFELLKYDLGLRAHQNLGFRKV